MDSIAQLKDQQTLIAEVRNSGAPDAAARAAALWTSYHDVQMAKVSTDVYDAAEDKGQPSTGWKRASADPDSLADVAGQLGLTPTALNEMLKPDDSGFRAEIYLPDPDVLGPGFKPVVAFKGSAGKVEQADGTLRDTTFEDFLANDFTQASGLRADYFDRAMQLAAVVRNTGFDCEGAGHSLGGGTASAFSAISGRHSTTFNAAGLHPETARRFAQENPGIQIHDVSRSIRAYEVSGELLNHGLQDNFRTMNAARREKIGDVLEELSIALKTVPEGRGLLERQLEAAPMPEHARDATRGFIDTLATGNAGKLLADIPPAAGMRQPPLRAMTERDGALIERDAAIGIPALLWLAGPVINVAHAGAQGAHIGREAGEMAQDAGRFSATQVGRGGAIVGGPGVLAGALAHQATLKVNEVAVAGVDVAGRGVAQGRRIAGEVEAGIDHLQGDVQARAAAAGATALRSLSELLPDGLKRDARAAADGLDRSGEHAQRMQHAEARLARREAGADADGIRDVARGVERSVATQAVVTADLNQAVIASPGAQVMRGTDAAAAGIDVIAVRAPGFGTMHGAIGGTALGAAAELGTSVPAQMRAAASGALAIPTLDEASERHKQVPTGLPSMEAHFEQQQADAREWLKQQTRAAPAIEDHQDAVPAKGVPAAAASPVQPSASAALPADPRDAAHPDHVAYQQIHRVVTSDGRWNNEQATNIAANLLGTFKADAPGECFGMAVVGRPFDNGDVNVFAVTAFAGPGGGQRVAVSGQEAAAVPMQQSFEQLEQVNQQQVLAQQQTQQIAIDEPTRRGPMMG